MGLDVKREYEILSNNDEITSQYNRLLEYANQVIYGDANRNRKIFIEMCMYIMENPTVVILRKRVRDLFVNKFNEFCLNPNNKNEEDVIEKMKLFLEEISKHPGYMN